MHRIPSLLALLALSSAAMALPAGGDGWLIDFEKAKAQAAKENKDLLIDFTGSDWCGWCIKLRDEVFEQEAFKKEAPKHFVLVELDYPRDKSEMSEETIAQNEKLQAEYGIEGFPTIWLTDAQGRPYAKTGYQQGGPEKYLEHLTELRQNREKRDELLKKAEGAEGMDRAALLDQALEALPEAAVPFYMSTIKEIISLTSEGDELHAKYVDLEKELALRKRFAALKTKVNAHAEKQEWKEAAALVADFVEKEKLDKGETAQEVLYIYGVLTMRGGEKDKALELLQKAIDAAPESRMAQMLKRNLEQMKGN